jgi:hypothetical protein
MATYNSVPDEGSKFVKNWILWFVVMCLIISVGTWFFSRSVQVVDTGFVRYQEFQEIWNTTTKINNDLCNLQKVDEKDKMFHDFSKAQLVLAQQNNLNRWIAEYNAKSSLINFSVWKSNTLPHTINQSQFNCAN